MLKSSIFPVAPSATLADLRTIIENKEQTLGRLLAVSPYRREATWLTYQKDLPPGKTIRVDLIGPNASPPSLPGFDLVCIGDCFIEDGSATVAVYRAL